MASDNHPHHIRRFNQSLVSRFVSGMVVRIERPDRDLRAALIRRLAEKRRVRLSDAAVEELASHVGTSVRELEGAMTRLAAWRGMMHPDAPDTEIGLLLVQQVLNEDRVRPTRIVRVATIIDSVCQRLNITRVDLTGTGRHRRVVVGRSMVAYLSRELTTMSFPEIAQALGRDNHSTVHTADQRLREQLKRDERLEPGGDDRSTSLRELADLLRRDICRGS
jgi:chromosomal replication initiator protein